MKDTLYIVVPCYNEEAVLPITYKMFVDKIHDLQAQNLCNMASRVLFVNDGSTDKTWEIIKKLSDENKEVEGISLSKNRGHQNALLAGLMYAKDKAKVTISIDCDGQDDINAMNEFMREYYNGNDIVYGVRNNRDTDTFFKKFTAESFYKFMKIMGTNTVFNHADYRLLSKRVLECLSEFHEKNLFLRGLIPLIGYKSTNVYYARNERIAGKSHYSISKMFNLAINGITSLSVKPLRYITLIGFIMSFIGILFLIYAIYSKLVGNTIVGWTSLVCIMSIIGGIQLFCLGVIGEYIGKIYSEVKARPNYFISEVTEK